MGTFATTTSLQTLMVATEFDTATTALAAKCIEQAENEIRKKLSRIYDLTSNYFQTSTSTPPLITSMCETYSEGLMWIRMSRGAKESIKRGQIMIELVDENLELLMNGELDLFNTAGSIIPQDASRDHVLCNTTNYAPTFNEDSELNWEVDPDKEDDIADGRL